MWRHWLRLSVCLSQCARMCVCVCCNFLVFPSTSFCVYELSLFFFSSPSTTPWKSGERGDFLSLVCLCYVSFLFPFWATSSSRRHLDECVFVFFFVRVCECLFYLVCCRFSLIFVQPRPRSRLVLFRSWFVLVYSPIDWFTFCFTIWTLTWLVVSISFFFVLDFDFFHLV